MTQEEKELLLKDLSARLYYGVKVTYNISGSHYEEISTICGWELQYDDLISFKLKNGLVVGCNIKPYLRPMSSMTEEEKEELCKLCDFKQSYDDRDYFSHYGIEIISEYCVNGQKIVESTINYGVIDFFYERHLDWRGLIPMGLALEAPEDMYKFD